MPPVSFNQIQEWRRMCEDMDAEMPLEEVVRLTAGEFYELCNLASLGSCLWAVAMANDRERIGWRRERKTS